MAMASIAMLVCQRALESLFFHGKTMVSGEDFPTNPLQRVGYPTMTKRTPFIRHA